MTDSLHTFTTAAAVIAEALEASPLIRSVSLIGGGESFTSETARLKVEGSLPSRPEAKFSLNLDIS